MIKTTDYVTFFLENKNNYFNWLNYNLKDENNYFKSIKTVLTNVIILCYV